jgi:hypothetical protein
MPSNTLGMQNLLIAVDSLLPMLQDRTYELQTYIQGADMSTCTLVVDGSWNSQYSAAVVLPSSQFETIAFSSVSFQQQGDIVFNISIVTGDNVQVAGAPPPKLSSLSPTTTVRTPIVICAQRRLATLSSACSAGMVRWSTKAAV